MVVVERIMPIKTASKTKTTRRRPVLVTTLHRGVFFGLTSAAEGAEIVKLYGCRNVLYWPQACRGFLGLAANGPLPGAKIGYAAVSTELRNVTSVTDLSAEVADAFTSFPVWA